MEERYSVMRNGVTCGMVQLQTEGLYAHLLCRCSKEEESIYRLEMGFGGNFRSLGVLLPQGDVLVLEKKIPLRQMPEGDIQFQLRAKDETEHWFPISETTLFSSPEQLLEGRFAIRNGRAGILLP